MRAVRPIHAATHRRFVMNARTPAATGALHDADARAAQTGVTSRAPRWGAVFALTLCVATLIASEFMPISLLTPIATDLHMSEGRAGQAIAVSGVFAVITSLGISSATR